MDVTDLDLAGLGAEDGREAQRGDAGQASAPDEAAAGDVGGSDP